MPLIAHNSHPLNQKLHFFEERFRYLSELSQQKQRVPIRFCYCKVDKPSIRLNPLIFLEAKFVKKFHGVYDNFKPIITFKVVPMAVIFLS
jgi:hypothetical protein